MDYSFHPAAEAELNDAIDYYESIQTGLGVDLAEQVEQAVARAVKFPTPGASFESLFVAHS